MALELFGTHACPFTAELREELQWQERAFVEYDVAADGAALARMRELVPGAAAVPILIEDGRVVHVGYHGRSCYVAPA